MIDRWIAPILLSTALFIGAARLDERPLKQWSPIAADAYVEVINNTKIALPIFAQAFEVDSATRYIGTVPACSHSRLKLPYVDTRVTLIIADTRYEINVDKPKTYGVQLSASRLENQCQYVTKPVSSVIEPINGMAWRRSPFFRETDQTTPFKLVIAGDNTACVVWEFEVTPVRWGDLYECKTPWRFARSAP